MIFNKDCKHQEHDGEETIGFCFHKDCEEEPEFCYLCLQDRQQAHMSDCFRFKQLLDKIQEQQNVLNNLKESFKNQYEQLLQQLQKLSNCIANEEARLIEFISIIKKKDYDEVKLRWNEFRPYVKSSRKDDFAKIIMEKLNNSSEQIHQIVEEYYQENERSEQFFDLNQISESIVIQQYIPPNKNQQQELQPNEERKNREYQQQIENDNEEQNKVNQIQNNLQNQPQNDVVEENQQNEQNFQDYDQDENEEYFLSQYNIQIAQDLVNQGNENIKLATPLIQSKNYNRAVQILKESFTYDKQNDEAYYLISKSLFKLKKSQEALEHINICLQLNSKFEEAYYVKGKILEKLDRKVEAVNCFQRAENNPKYINDKFYLRVAQIFINLQKGSEAIKYCDKAINFEINNANAYNVKAIAQGIVGQYNQALQNYDKAIQFNHQHPNIYSNKALLLQRMGRLEEALQCYSQAIQYGKEKNMFEISEAYKSKLQLLTQLGKNEESLDCVNQMIQLYPQNSEPYQLKITILRQLNRHEEADYNIRIKEQSWAGYNQRGCYFYFKNLKLGYQQHRTFEAVANFEMARNLNQIGGATYTNKFQFVIRNFQNGNKQQNIVIQQSYQIIHIQMPSKEKVNLVNLKHIALLQIYRIEDVLKNYDYILIHEPYMAQFMIFKINTSEKKFSVVFTIN